MAYQYTGSVQGASARAVGVGLPISPKHCVEICAWLRGKNLQKARSMLQRVVEMKNAVPFKKYNHNIGHRPGMGPGRYPIKACQHIMKLLQTVEANAKQKGLDASSLVLAIICAQRASAPRHQGRHGGRSMKRAHVEVTVVERKSAPAKSTPSVKTETPKAQPAQEIKKETQSVESAEKTAKSATAKRSPKTGTPAVSKSSQTGDSQ